MTEIELLNGLRKAVIQGDIEEAERLAIRTVSEGVNPLLAFDEGLRKGITEVGDGFACGDYYLPDLVLSAEAMKAASVVLEREIARTGQVRTQVGKVIMGTVEGDLHDIGKTIVSTLLAAHGFEVIDLGVNVPARTFLDAVHEHSPQLLGMSSLLTITARELTKVIDGLHEAGIRDSVKVIVGGGAVTQEFADRIGADGFAHDAEIGVRVAKRLMNIE